MSRKKSKKGWKGVLGGTAVWGQEWQQGPLQSATLPLCLCLVKTAQTHKGSSGSSDLETGIQEKTLLAIGMEPEPSNPQGFHVRLLCPPTTRQAL